MSSHPLHCKQFPGGRRIKLKTTALLAWMAVLLTAGLFLFRGPLRADSGYVNDFAAPYTATRLWLQHRNPYDSTAFFPTWHDAGADRCCGSAMQESVEGKLHVYAVETGEALLGDIVCASVGEDKGDVFAQT